MAEEALATPAPAFTANVRRNRFEDEQVRLMLAAILPPAANVVDVGAHGGEFLREVLRLAPEGQHIAFEPLPKLAARLTRLFPDVDVREVALCDQEGRSGFMRVRGALPYSGFRRRQYPPEAEDVQEIEVRTQRLDSALPAGYAPTLVKIDVEGAEESVLRGGMGTLREHRPVILFEHSAGGATYYSTTPAVIHGLLVDVLGYRIFDLAGDGPYDCTRFQEAFDQHRWINYLARP
ncbi:MAG: hypothetical protein AVDCRST_MAG76-1962 [uncultured Acidimicrobiales bacterium]|uniref:Methyltransferase FkbM domain-containing protein n=1 Tax=uncultured Acidimicrobiales bacterium TaxID=310071 RepID=A0A6J4I7V2_9ACTN|nr:MAG: hypothetical protein AVDCRST_MAG76-1962 [uncultured Acidimicrobiales bacterium]